MRRLLAFFVIFALVEMATFFWVQARIGLGWALLLAVTTAILGSYLVRRAGLSVWARLRNRVDRGELPGRELTDGAAILVAGVFLISPGFFTDLLGFLLLVPQIRGVVHRVVAGRVSGRVALFTPGRWPPNAVTGRPGHEVIDVDEVD
ncbi:MAG TPA: FxsA family protein [Acidimicrobiia bacterium]|nr:FxsA family protein [Acidimicrobiia bacterium]